MITASIVTYHTDRKDLERLMDCVRRSPVRKLFLVDHAAEDSLKDFAGRYDWVEYIAQSNRGYGAGHNTAIRKALAEGADYHVVLNPDIYWDGPVIQELESYMNKHPEVGQLMPQVYYPDGQLQYLCKLVPTPLDLIFKRFLPSFLTHRRMQRFQLRFSGYNRIMNVPYLSGCFMFFRLTALQEVGLFDERFFMYPEDIDLTRRMHARYRTEFYPYVSIIHAHAAASKTSGKMLRIHLVNMIRYFNKWGWIFDRQRKEFNRRLLDELNRKND